MNSLGFLGLLFSIGFASSLHCAGMCGPIALALPFHGKSSSQRFLGFSLYSLGRVTTYVLLGLIVGLLGKSIALGGFQQSFSIFLGSVIFIGLLFQLFGKRIQFLSASTPRLQRLLTQPFLYLRKQLGLLMHQPQLGFKFLIGNLNGLLPCGMVYMALATTISAGNVLQSALGMLFFGLGTIPAMVAIFIVRQKLTFEFRNQLNRLVPLFVGIMALLLICRGMNLGIPYLSPKAVNGSLHTLSCCHK